jgi:hypothetical protein
MRAGNIKRGRQLQGVLCLWFRRQLLHKVLMILLLITLCFSGMERRNFAYNLTWPRQQQEWRKIRVPVEQVYWTPCQILSIPAHVCDNNSAGGAQLHHIHFL